MKTYVTFGQNHAHSINGKTLDKDCVAVITHSLPNEGRNMAFEMFGTKFGIECPEEFWREDQMKFFPRGYVEVN